MINVEFHPSHPELTQTFARILRDDPDYAARLSQTIEEGDTGDRRIAAAHFNGQPIGVAVLHGNALDWLVVHPATRGRGVARDFIQLIEKQLGTTVSLPKECRQ